MSNTLIRVEVEGPAGPLNNAICTHTFGDDSPGDTEALGITVAAYIAKATLLQGVDVIIGNATAHSLSGGVVGPGASIPWNQDYWDDWKTIDSDLPTATGWGFTADGLGTSLAAAGVSITITESVVSGGRHNGRHYLPWTCKDAISSAGLVGSTVRTNLVENYNWKMLGSVFTRPTWAADITPNVRSAAGTLSTVYAAVCSANPARLRSRVR